ncbi:unnamed protein product, partial [Polarella glacialis]
MNTLMPQEQPIRRGLSRRFEQSLQWVPGLLDTSASPGEVVSICSALQRVASEDHFNTEKIMYRHYSSPAKLNQMGSHDGGKPKTDWARLRQVAWLVFLFVALDTSKSLAVSWAAVHGNMCAPLVICSKNMMSIAVGLAMAFLLDGSPGVHLCLDWRRSLRVLPIAAAFCAAQICGIQACRVFDAGSLKMIAQVNLPLTTLLSWLMLGRRYSVNQWFAMALLFTATIIFLQVRMLFFSPKYAQSAQSFDQLHQVPDKVLGIFYILFGILLSCSASICAERFLKKRYDLPFYIQKTNLMFGELLSACLMVGLSAAGGRDLCSREQLQDWRQLPVVLIWLTHGWIAGLLVKRCSAL